MNNMIIVCIYGRFDNEDRNTKHNIDSSSLIKNSIFNESKNLMFKDLAACIPYSVCRY